MGSTDRVLCCNAAADVSSNYTPGYPVVWTHDICGDIYYCCMRCFVHHNLIMSFLLRDVFTFLQAVANMRCNDTNFRLNARLNVLKKSKIQVNLDILFLFSIRYWNQR